MRPGEMAPESVTITGSEAMAVIAIAAAVSETTRDHDTLLAASYAWNWLKELEREQNSDEGGFPVTG